METNNDLKNKIIALSIAFGALIFVISLILFSGYLLSSNTSTTDQISINLAQSQYADFNVIKGNNKDENINTLNITDICPKGGCVKATSAAISFSGIERKYKVVGKFSRAYLYIDAQVDYSRPLTSWDDIYFKINDMGGHLVSNDDNSLSVPPSNASSRYLYNLSSVSYFPTGSNKMRKTNENKNINLFNLLQDTAQLNINVTVSSDRPGRVLREVSIYYECTEGSSCVINEIK
jgi:hypothetical protein